MSDRKMVVFTTFEKSTPAVVSIAFIFSIAFRVSLLISAVTSSPVAASLATCPEIKIMLPASIA
jgi:hypothetical protein